MYEGEKIFALALAGLLFVVVGLLYIVTPHTTKFAFVPLAIGIGHWLLDIGLIIKMSRGKTKDV